MNFKQFQALGKDCADLRTDPTIGPQLTHDAPVPGRTYGDGLFLEATPHASWEAAEPQFVLTIGNDSRILSLATAERALYDFAVTECYIVGDETFVIYCALTGGFLGDDGDRYDHRSATDITSAAQFDTLEEAISAAALAEWETCEIYDYHGYESGDAPHAAFIGGQLFKPATI
jgi:hypothetical protein